MNSKPNIFERILKAAALAMFLIFALFPIYWIVITSFKPVKDSVTVPIQYWPKHFTFDNYISIWKLTEFPTFFKNSLIVAVVTGIITVLLAILAGYSLARFKFRGKNLTLLLFLVTQMIPVVVMIVPLFILFQRIGFLDKLIGLIVPYTIISVPFCTLMIEGFFKQIPAAIEESAMIDGCSRFGALFKVIVPIMLPGIVATFVFAFLGAWNEFFFSVMFINSEAIKTIPVGISIFIQKVDVNWAMMTAAATVSMIPAIILFLFIQKYLIKGLASGAVKG
jgi:multiple sugar transport system permease protein